MLRLIYTNNSAFESILSGMQFCVRLAKHVNGCISEGTIQVNNKWLDQLVPIRSDEREFRYVPSAVAVISMKT